MTKTDTTPEQLNGNSAPPAKGRASTTDAYLEVTRFVMRKIVPLYRVNAMAIDAPTCAAIAATLYIERSKRGQ